MPSLMSAVPAARGEVSPRMAGLLRAASFVDSPYLVPNSTLGYSFAVRSARAGDQQVIASLRASAGANCALPANGHAQDRGEALAPEVLVAIDRATDACIGFVVAEMRRFGTAADPAAPLLAKGSLEREGELHIVEFCVSADYSGCGVERLLLGQVLERCSQLHPKCRSALLFVRRSDLRMRQMAAAQRFLVVDCLNEFMGEYTCMLAMRRYFTSVVR